MKGWRRGNFQGEGAPSVSGMSSFLNTIATVDVHQKGDTDMMRAREAQYLNLDEIIHAYLNHAHEPFQHPASARLPKPINLQGDERDDKSKFISEETKRKET